MIRTSLRAAALSAVFLLLAPLAQPSVPPLAQPSGEAAQQPSARAAALVRELTDSPALASSDFDQLLARVEPLLLAADRSVPSALVEAALLYLARSSSDFNQPRSWLAALERLQGARDWSAAARSVAAEFLARERNAYRAASELDPQHDSFPDTLRELRLLAPLDGPELARRGEDLFADPGYERAHPGLRGASVSWTAVRRSGLYAGFEPAEWIEPVEGWALCAWEFECEAEGPLWLEIDSGGSHAARAATAYLGRERGWRGGLGDPAWSYAVDGAAPVAIDPLRAERDPSLIVPLARTDGVHRALIFCRTDAYPTFTLRVWAADPREPGLGRPVRARAAGRPFDKQSVGREHAALPAPRTLCERLPRATAHEQALLGLLLIQLEQPIAGLEHLAQAARRAPESDALQALHAGWLSNAGHLPEVWRRSRARTTLEALAARSSILNVELALAHTLTLEDKEEEALARLEAARTLAPHSARPLLELADTYPRLDLHGPARRMGELALELAPEASRVLEHAADERAQYGLPREGAQLRRRIVRTLGAYPQTLVPLSEALAEAGEPEEALAVLREADRRSGRHGQGFPIVQFLIERGRWDEAEAELELLAREFPRWVELPLARARIAHRRGDRAAEEQHLRAAQVLQPSSWTAREGLRALQGGEPTDALFKEFRADRAQALAGYDAARWNDSVVRVLDSQVIRVFADGGWESLTHDIVQVKDLEGCEREGQQSLDGTVERIVTIKAGTGEELEPLEVDGSYVMPKLKPGDTIERVWRSWAVAPEDGIARLNRWSFASYDEPFVWSRWVVILPRSMQLELLARNFDGTHETLERGEDLIHVFETRNTARVVPEPGAPPPQWVLPSVEFGVRPRAEDAPADLFAEARLATRLTPELRAAAQQVLEELGGTADESARARALHAFVQRTVKQRDTDSPASALFTLLSEQGNPAHLFAALLEAAGIEHELAWSRDVSPESDPEPDARFMGAERWGNRLLVRVRPAGGPEAWCDLSLRELPYGKLLGNAPRAEVRTQRGVENLPDVPLEERVGQRVDLVLDVRDDLSAGAELRLLTTGNTSYQAKERLRELPENQLKAGLGRALGQILPGFDLERLELEGLDDERELVIVAHGKVARFLDESSEGITARLPLPALNLSAGLAGGEGERRLPYFLSSAIVQLGSVKLTLPEGLTLVQGPPPSEERFLTGRYALSIEQQPDGRTLLLRRDLLLAPFYITKDEYPKLAAFCARVDELERVPLVFTR